MKIWFLFYPLLLVTIHSQIPVHDGETVTGQVDTEHGGEVTFAYNLTELAANTDLVFSVTTYSDWQEPDLYASGGRLPNEHNYEFSAVTWGASEIVIGSRQVRANTIYYLLAKCPTFCRFTLTLHYSEPIQLTRGVSLRTSLLYGTSKVLIYQSNDSSEALRFSAVPTGLQDRFQMNVNSEGWKLPVQESWFLGFVCSVAPPVRSTYTVEIKASAAVEVIVTVESTKGVRELIASVPTEGGVAVGEWSVYKFYVADVYESVYVMQTVYTGFHDLYLRAALPPTLNDFSLKLTKQGNETLALPPSLRRSYGSVTGWFYIGILGHARGTYLLTVSVNKNSFVQLFQGISHSGVVEEEELFYFYLEVPIAKGLNITVSVHPTSGNPDVYMQLCTTGLTSIECQFTSEAFQNMTHTTLHYSNALQGNKQISFHHEESLCYNTMCRYVICVKGREGDASGFVIMGTYEDRAEHLLRDGFPLQLTVVNRSERYFKYQVYDPRILRLSFQLTSMTGQSTFCISRENDRPVTSQCQQASYRSQLPDHRVEYVRGVDSDTLDSTYYLTVISSSNDTFSLLAHELLPDMNTTIALFPGQGQRDALVHEAGGEFRFYRFELAYTPKTKQPIDIRLTPITGRFHIYVANTQSAYNPDSKMFHFNWSTEAIKGIEESNHIHIETTDPAYISSGTYEVLVLVSDWMGAQSVEFSIMYTSGNGLITLKEGERLGDMVEMGQYRYYMVEMSMEPVSVTVVVEETYGDPDLYVSVLPYNPKPTIDHSDYHESTYGGEAVTFDWTLSNAIMCADPSIPCAVYISVYGFSQASYTIIVRTRSEERVMIEHGVEIKGRLENGEYAYFYSPLDDSKSSKVILQSSVGEASLYLFLSPNLDEPLIRVQNAVHSVESILSPGVLAFEPATYPAICATARCYFDFSVLCRSSSCRYIVLILQGEDIELLEGRPTQYQCATDDMTYFRFFIGREVTNIVLALTVLTAGDPDLYVSRRARPTINAAEWSAEAWGSDLMEITMNDTSLRGEYYVGVYCDSPSTFSLSLGVDKTLLSRLIGGKPSYSSLKPYSVAYFYYKNEETEDLFVSVTPTIGELNVFVETHDDHVEDIYEKLPNATRFVWSGKTSNDNSLIPIPHSDPHFCVQCNYVISVFSLSQASSFTILVRSAEQISTLSSGIPVRLSPQVSSTHKFAYQLLHKADLDVSLTVFTGLGSLYMSTSPLLSPALSNWTASDATRVSHIHVTTTDPAFIIGWYYILVTTEGPAHMTVSAHSRDSYSMLVDGWPQTYSIAFSDQDRLMFEYRSRNESSYCRLTPYTTGLFPVAYVTYRELDDTIDFPPGPRHNYFTYSDYDPFQGLMFSLPMPGFGKFYIGIYGRNYANITADSMGDFQLYCVSKRAATVISLDEVQFAVLDSLSPSAQYELHITGTGELEITVVPCTGKISLRIFSDARFEGVVDVRQKRMEDGRVQGKLDAVPGKYFVRVEAELQKQLMDGVSFQLVAKMITAASPQSSSLYPGNEGQLDWSVVNSSYISLSWSPLETSSGEVFSAPSTIRYFLYASLKPSVMLATTCGMHMAEFQNSAWQLTEELFGVTTCAVEVPVGETVVVNVMAVAGSEDDPDVERIAYTPVEVFIKDTSIIRLMYRFALVIVGVSVLLVVVSVWLCLKYRTQAKANLILTELAAPTVVTHNLAGVIRSINRFESDVESVRETTGRLISMDAERSSK